MSDFFDNFNKILKKEIVPILSKYLNEPSNKITDNLNQLFNDPQTLLTDVFQKFSDNKDIDNNKRNYMNIENLNDMEQINDDEYDELFKRLILIEENMVHIENILKDKN